MLTQANLTSAFAVYLDELKNCHVARCYWAMLHMLVILPDLCGALESRNGEATSEKYKDWCKRYLGQELSPDDWWSIRCGLLHQGRTFKKDRFQLSFGQPAPDGSDQHNIIILGQSGNQTRILDIDRLRILMTKALNQWFRDLEEGKDHEKVHNVEANLPYLAKRDERTSVKVYGVGFLNLNTSSGQGSDAFSG